MKQQQQDKQENINKTDEIIQKLCSLHRHYNNNNNTMWHRRGCRKRETKAEECAECATIKQLSKKKHKSLDAIK